MSNKQSNRKHHAMPDEETFRGACQAMVKDLLSDKLLTDQQYDSVDKSTTAMLYAGAIILFSLQNKCKRAEDPVLALTKLQMEVRKGPADKNQVRAKPSKALH